ncbi:hypothetical protein BP6252_08279 [Coleophoma cylindrospora]|uniref:Carrier domain-containing protein n=1 Tax=Coleophoma cylindrospora TaxID=1849047 RepID=A0A3D8R5E4_9HELO|nr:hypothetical protein BP6252_08279 [Coleophoma cylindrospora]
MPSLPALVPETPFPSLDTVYRRPHAALENDSCTTNQQQTYYRTLRRDFPQLEIKTNDDTIFESYARFIGDFTGRDEVSFHASSQQFARSRSGLVHATILENGELSDANPAKTVSCTFHERQATETAEDSADFAVNISNEGNVTISGDATQSFVTPFILTIDVDLHNNTCHVFVQADAQLMSECDFQHIFNVLCSYLTSSHISDAETSVLNFPPLSQPPLLLQDEGLQPQKSLLHAPFERRARQYPDRMALDFLQMGTSFQETNIRRKWSYSALNELTTQLAIQILATINGQKTRKVVPILLSTSAELYISYLAVLKAGLAFCPLPIDAPAQRLQDIVDDLDPQVIIGSELFRSRLPSLQDVQSAQKWLDVESFVRSHSEGLIETNAELPEPEENSIAYVMYTSGSTGKPKGVQITHIASSCSIAAHALTSPLPQAADGVPRWFQFAAPTFDPSLMEIFVTLSTGATLCSASRDLTLTDFEGTVTELGATVMMSTPSMAAVVDRSRLSTLHSLWTMGETVLRKNIDDFATEPGSSRKSELCNAYGPTECAINCTLLPNFHPGDRGSIIGPALSTCSLLILDPLINEPTPLPRGFPGELAIGGPQVSIGYINRPEQNAKAFVESSQFGRLYRTGDKSRIVTDRNGQLVVEFLGRLDTSQVKLSGRRVDLGEIDAIVASAPGVKEAVTVSYKRFSGQAGSEEAVTFVVLQPAHVEREVEDSCRKVASHMLPSYMCPSKYFFVDNIPRSLAGKVDRKTLTAMVQQLWKEEHNGITDIDPSSDSEDFELSEAAKDIEAVLCDVLAQITGRNVQEIKPTTNFFGVGIDSLRAVRYLQRAREVHIIELTIVDVLKNATPRSLAALVLERRSISSSDTDDSDSTKSSADSITGMDISGGQEDRSKKQYRPEALLEMYRSTCEQRLGVDPGSIRSILPTTATQSGMLASFLRSSGSSSGRHYVHHSVHHLNASVDVQKLQKSWVSVLDRHDAYRMVFLPIDEKIAPFLQCVLSPGTPLTKVSWNVVEQSREEDFDLIVHASMIAAENELSIEVPPFKLTLINTPNDTVILFSIFHGVFDGASLQLLFEEVEIEYAGKDVPARTEIRTAVDMHYISDAKRTVDFWSEQLKESDPEPFPCLTGWRPEAVTETPRTTSIISTVNLNQLREGARQAFSSPLTVLQAAWSLLLTTYKDSLNSSTFGSVISGRLDPDSAICVGPTFTTIPVTIPASKIMAESPSISNLSVLQLLAELNANALEHLQIPLNSIVSAGGGLFYDTLLAFQDFEYGAEDSELWHKVDYPAMGNDFAVMMEIWPEIDGNLRIRATYTDTHLDDKSAILMLQQFNDIVSFIVNNPAEPYMNGRFSTLPSSSDMSSSVSQLTGRNGLLHSQFEDNAKFHPDDIALVFKYDLNQAGKNIEWTYSELNEKANSLASYLVTRFGTMYDKVVPICFEKSPELYIAVLAIVKAGAAWCPIDPTFPVQRRHDLIARTDAEMLLVGNNTVVQVSSAIPAGVTLIDVNNLEDQDSPVDLLLNISPKPEHMAYLIWTSGTTGMPKGVQVQHNSASAAMRSLQEVVTKSNEETVLCMQFSQPTFDVFVQDLFYTWGLRGTVISATKEIMLGSFAALANSTKATHAHLTPAFATIVPRQDCETLQVITTIGEALPQKIADDWGHNMRAYNTYGPAEAAVVSTVKQFGGIPNDFKSTNIGFTLPSLGAYVINDNKSIMRNGVGELALSGPQVARGYWKDNVKTEDKFFWNNTIGARIYMTGDVVRMLHDGSFEYVGRRDDLVKLNGQRVELSEISFVLEDSHPDVEQAVTMHMGRSDRPTKVIVVFLSVPKLEGSVKKGVAVTSDVATEIATAAMAQSRKALPEHMIPSVIIILDSIPITASAKIDRKILSSCYETLDLESWESKISPAKASEWSKQESVLVQHIADFSGTAFKSIGRNSRLAALGIDSIGAIRLTARLGSRGYAVSTAGLLQCRTVTDLCELLERPTQSSIQSETSSLMLEEFHHKWSPEVAEYLQVCGKPNFVVCPSLPLQENLLSESFRNYESYWSNHFFELAPTVDLDALQESWVMVALHNQALRAGFIPRAALSQETSSEDHVSTLLQILYDTAKLDWTICKTNDKDIWTKAKLRSQEIALKHQKTLFLQPCWAVTILETETTKTMVLTIHHSIHDGPSLQFIMDDLRSAYLEKKAPTRLRHQLSDAVAIAAEARTTPAEDQEFWEPMLKDFADDDEGIVEQETVSRQHGGYNLKTIPLSVNYTDLKTAAQNLGCSSVTSILRAAWACIVADFLELSEKKVVIGEVFSERAVDASLDDIVGPLVSLVPVPFDVFGTSRSILAKHDKSMGASFKYRNANPGLIRKLIKRPKNKALYPAVFVFHPYTAAPTQSKDNDLWEQKEDRLGLHVEHDLALNVEQQQDGSLDLEISAEESILGPEGVEMLTKQLNALISTMITYPDKDIPELTNYFPRELASVTKEIIPTYPDIVKVENPLCWLEHWAQTRPHWPAVGVADRIEKGSTHIVEWNYAQLNDEAERVAAFIASCGVRGRTIGMCLGRTLEAFAVTVGIFKSGNTYLPVDEDLPIERKVFLLQDSNSAIFFTTENAAFAPEGCKVVNVEKDNYKLESTIPVNIVRDKEEAAYLLFTSGSTGNPKGVLISCANLSSFNEALSEFICEHAPDTLNLGGTGRYLGLASRAFDVHVAEMFLAWRRGMSAVTAKRSMLLDDLPLALQELKITHTGGVPSLLEQVGLQPSDVPLLRYIGVGGEKISQRILDTFGESKTLALINAYGPTEATIGVSAAKVFSNSSPRNVGRPFKGSVAHVLIPDTLIYAKRGMEGELCITGNLVGIGYHNRSSGAFVDDFHGAKMYRTGDLVRLMPDDTIEIFGRSDDQTKIRGQRLELGEVSECVRSLSPGGSDVATLIIKHPGLPRMQLVSFVAHNKAQMKDSKASFMTEVFAAINSNIRAGCKERLPAYMVPDIVVPITFLPLAPTSGKANVKELKAMFSSIPLQNLLTMENKRNKTDSRELNEAEMAVVSILKGVVAESSTDIRPSTNIFEVGVDSLVAISLSARMRKNGYDCTVADILSLSTVEDLALLPRNDRSASQIKQSKAVALQRLEEVNRRFTESARGIIFGDRTVVARPCLPVQEAVVARSLDKDSADSYVNHITFKLSKDADLLRLKNSWDAAIRDNEILRTCFCQVENDILQVVLKHDHTSLSWEDCTAENPESEIQQQRESTASDIVKKIQEVPPMRVKCIRSTGSSEAPLLCVSMHHALYDAESLSILMDEIYLRYQSKDLPERPQSGALVEHVAAMDKDAAKSFWTKLLGDHQISEQTNADLTNPEQAQTSTRILRSSLSSLESCSSKLHVTLPTLAQAIFGLAMAKANSINDFVFGLVLSGRSVPVLGIENLLAPAITTVPQRLDLRNANGTVVDLLSTIQKSSGQLIQYQHTSLRLVHRWVEADRPLFNTLLSYIKPGAQPSYDDVWNEVNSYMPPDYPFAVEFEANASSDQLIIRAIYTSDFGSTTKVDNMLEMMEILIDTICKGENPTIASFGIESSSHYASSSQQTAASETFTQQEITIRDILIDLADIEADHVSRNSTFFRLGIDSVIAIRFAQKLRAIGFAVSSSDVARYPSIALLSEHISSAMNNSVNEISPKSSSATSDLDIYKSKLPVFSSDDVIQEVYACTPLQTGLLTQTIANEGRLYVHHPALQLAGDVDIQKLKEAFATVVENHDILRTTFHYMDSEILWISAVHSQSIIDWTEVQVEESAEASIKSIVETVTYPSTDSFSKTPLKATLLKASDSNILVISLHHSLYDGWSLPLIFEALSSAYHNGQQQSQSGPFFKAARLITECQSGSVEFWQKQISGYQATRIPSSQSTMTTSTNFSSLLLGSPTADILEKCKAMDINLQSAALLAYGKALCSTVGSRDVVFGQVVSGRSLPLPDVESIVGPLFNTVPFRVRLDNPLITNEKFAASIQQVVGEAQDHQHASLNSIQKKWRQTEGTEAALIDALFVLQKTEARDEPASKKLWTALSQEDDRDATEYGLNAELEQGPQHLTLSVASPAGRLNSDDLKSFCYIFEEALQDILSSSQRSVTACPETLQNLPITIKATKKDPIEAKETPIINTPELRVIRTAFSEVSQIPLESITSQTSIYAIGIDSITAIKVASLCRRQDVNVSVADVLQGRSLGGIAQIVASKADANKNVQTRMTKLSAEAKEDVLARIEIDNAKVEEILPCLAGQSYHLASWLKSGRTFYEPTWPFKSSQKIDSSRLASAWQTLRNRHPVLRTIFVTTDDHTAYQVVLHADAVDDSTFQIVECRDDFIEAVKKDVKESQASPSTLLTPPISLRLLQGEKQDAVTVKIHHSLYDAWSMNALVSELSSIYLGNDLQSVPKFSDFVWHTLNCTEQQAEKKYWNAALAEAQPTILTSSRVGDSSVPTMRQTFVWAKQCVQGVEEMTKIARNHGLALSTVVTLAFGRALAKRTQVSNPTFGFFHVGRSASFQDAASVPGPTVNLLPMTTSGTYTTDVQAALAIQDNLSSRVPYEQSNLRDILSYHQNSSHPKPMFNASLNLLWHSTTTTPSSEAETEPLLKLLQIGVPTDFAPQEPITSTTAVDSLDVGYLANQNLFMDVGPVAETDSIDFGVKADYALMNELEVESFIDAIKREILDIIRGLKGETGA